MAERADHGAAAREERARQVAAVMRENLKKRKEQGRARAGQGDHAREKDANAVAAREKPAGG